MIDSMYVLTDVAGMHWWTGKDFILIGEGDPCEARALMQFRSRREAEAAVRSYMRRDMYLRAVRVRLLVGEMIQEPVARWRRGRRQGEPARTVFTRNGTCPRQRHQEPAGGTWPGSRRHGKIPRS